jgi:hypothetical protein
MSNTWKAILSSIVVATVFLFMGWGMVRDSNQRRAKKNLCDKLCYPMQVLDCGGATVNDKDVVICASVKDGSYVIKPLE